MHRLSVRAGNFVSLGDIGGQDYGGSPLTRKRNNAAFITDNNIIQNEQEIQQRHSELNKYIDNLDHTVQKRVENSEAEMLFAYKNHCAKVKKEMEEFKMETLEQANSSMNHTEKIEALEKQVIVFREESLRLFEKVVERDKTIEEMKVKLDQFEVQKRYMNEIVKELARKNKLSQAHIVKLESQEKVSQSDNIGKIDMAAFTSIGLNNYRLYNHRDSRFKDKTLATSVNVSKALTQTTHINRNKTNAHTIEKEDQNYNNFISSDLELFSKRLRGRLSYLEDKILKQVLQNAEEIFCDLQKINTNRWKNTQRDKEITDIRKTRFSMRSRSNYTAELFEESKQSRALTKNKQEVHKKSQSHSKSQQMGEYFVKCVQIVKKEIARRKGINSVNFFNSGSPMSLQQFKKIDFFRLIQLVFSNQKMIHVLYQALLDGRK